jgi:regulatory protein
MLFGDLDERTLRAERRLSIMTATITALRMQKRDKERVNVFLDGEYAFSVSLNAALALKRGQSLSPADIDCLQREDEVHRAYHHAIRMLGYRPRSRLEIERRLRQKGYSDEAIGAAIERLLANQRLDDAAFTQSWLDSRERFRPRGARALRYELRQKGIDNSTINEALTDLDEDALAWAAVEGKIDRWRTLDQNAFRKKVMGFLSRRGFRYATVHAVSQRAWVTIDLPDSD